ncbi:MAG TPA: hypothetical protein VNA16_01815 [Abditibacteriaceae bacterium]|nr:hypothetical protein [Abditibacteriaceae bacterium]
MDHPLSFLLAVITCLATVVFITLPLRRRDEAVLNGSAAEGYTTLLARRDALLRDLKDLEFDRNTGKISDADYTEMRAVTAEAASVVLQQLETSRKPHSPSRRRRLAIEAEVEVLIARARRRRTHEPIIPQTNGAPPAGVLPDAGLTAASQAGGWACQSCGRVMGQSDRFCASCGTARPE